MNAATWMEDWKEGVDSLNMATVSIERMKHQTAYIEQELDRLDQMDKSLLTKIKEWVTR